MQKSFKCSHVGCSVVGIAIAMFAHSEEDISSFTGSATVTINDVIEHVLCSKHAYLEKNRGRQVLGLKESIASAIARSEQRAKRVAIPNNSNVNRGLSALAQRDAAKYASPKLDSELVMRHTYLRERDASRGR